MNDLTAKPTTTRLGSIDAFRGLVMLLMMAEVLHFTGVARALPESGFWAFLSHHQSHVEWVGCSLHDLIQPSFSFLVGTALAFSMASRLAKGQSVPRMFGHAVWRSFLLIALGIFLRSIGRSQTNFTFEDTLTQIGLGYTFLFVAALRPRKEQWIALLLILVGYWAAFALYPLPGPGFDWTAAGVSPEWEYNLTGFAAHWNKNTNLAWAFDTWFLNLFPRESLFTHNGGGYATLSFIPTLGTMILGLIAGEWLKSTLGDFRKVRRLALVGLLLLALGWLFNAIGSLPECEADLDPHLGPVQRRLVFPDPRGVCGRRRYDPVQSLGVPADRDRDEPHRRLHDGSSVPGFHPGRPEHAPGRVVLPGARPRLRKPGPRIVHPADSLADPALDVPAEAVPEDLSGLFAASQSGQAGPAWTSWTECRASFGWLVAPGNVIPACNRLWLRSNFAAQQAGRRDDE